MAPKNDRQAAVSAAAKAWDGAPLHIRAMAGAYVGPLLEAIVAISAELDTIKGGAVGKCGQCSFPACDCKGECKGECNGKG